MGGPERYSDPRWVIPPEPIYLKDAPSSKICRPSPPVFGQGLLSTETTSDG